MYVSFASVMHRGSRYRIESMESPPPFLGGATFGRSGCTGLLAFARPVQVSYSTQALSISEITVVKQVDSMEIPPKTFINNNTPQTVAGRGIVTVKRSVCKKSEYDAASLLLICILNFRFLILQIGAWIQKALSCSSKGDISHKHYSSINGVRYFCNMD
jgi:hypothetical protein